MVQNVVVPEHHGARENMRDVTQQKHHTVVRNRLEHQVMRRVVDEHPKSVVDDGANRVRQQQAHVQVAIRGGGDGERNVEYHEQHGP